MDKLRFRSFNWLAFALVIFSCSTDSDTIFSKLSSSETNITFTNTNTETENFNILTYEYFYNGGGVAAGDINNDGLVDLYFTGNTGPNKLYLNEGNFRFRDITESSNTAAPSGWKTGVSMADVDGDGYLDICVNRSGPNAVHDRMNLLFLNNHDLTFREAAFSAKLNDPSYSTQTAFFDYDRDSDLDAFVLNHSLLGISNSFDISQRNTKKRHALVGNRLLENRNGKFYDVSDSVGVFGPASNYGLGVSLSDFNNDGWIDIYAGCDYVGRDRLLLNDNGMRFIDATDSLLSHISKFTMGTDAADINNDGLIDLFTLDMLPEDNYRQKQLQGSDRYDEYNAMVRNGLHQQVMRNMLHLNNGNGTFSEVGQLLNVSNTDWSWAPLIADFDNDGFQDIYVTNGFKRDLTNNDFAKFQAFEQLKSDRQQGKKTSMLDAISKFTTNSIPDYMFRSRRDSTFADVTKAWGLDEPNLTNGAVYADLDNDGDLDIVANAINSEAVIYRNNSDKFGNNNFLRLALSMPGKNTAAIGARVTAYAAGTVQVRELMPVRGFQSSVDPVIHFGLGKLASVDSILIRWPDGKLQSLSTTAANQRLEIRYDPNRETISPKVETRLFERADAPPFTHIENDFIDFREQRLLPRMYSREGPAAAFADVNGDGKPDYYFGGAAGKSGELFISSRDNFIKAASALLNKNKDAEDVDAAFFDADGDGDQDLFVVTGGYEIRDSAHLADRLYVNNGGGRFSQTKVPALTDAGSCVRPADIDLDGDVDLFVGSRLVPGQYPLPATSRLLMNDGKGNFTVSEALSVKGMVTDAVWSDLNNDKFPDLIIVGEWMPLKVYINEGGKKFDDRSSDFVPPNSEGLWNCIVAGDFDRDGDLDFVLGNQGLNGQIKPSIAEPASIIFNDFDGNGSIDPVMTYYVQHALYPYPGRDELTEQLPSFKKRFTDYHSYAVAGISGVLKPEEIAKAQKLQAFRFESSWLRNDGGKVVLIPLPTQAQSAPIFAMAVADVNGDGYDDIVTGGNHSGGRARTGRMTGNAGFVFTFDGTKFSFVPPVKTGIAVDGDVRRVLKRNGDLIFVRNNDSLLGFRLSVGASKIPSIAE